MQKKVMSTMYKTLEIQKAQPTPQHDIQDLALIQGREKHKVHTQS